MNSKYIQYNLREAKDSIDLILKEIGANSDYDSEELAIDIGHIYHHINTAWNSRNSSEAESIECIETNYNRWRQFPSEISFD